MTYTSIGQQSSVINGGCGVALFLQWLFTAVKKTLHFHNQPNKPLLDKGILLVYLGGLCLPH